ncbi:MAG: prolyl oligopeptidase family serine peptidase, partial [Deltaproteobacteria bacterium]
GRSVVATRSGDDQRGDLLVIDPSTGAVRAIASPRADGIAYAVDTLPDGTMLVLATNARGFAQLAKVDLATGASVFVGPGDWDVDDADVAADDGSVVYARNVHGESEVGLAPRADFEHVRVLARGGVVESVGIDRTARTITVLREASDHPSEIVSLDPSNGAVTVRVASDVAGVQVDRLARARRITLASFDGTPVDVFVWSPPVARLGTPPPLVVHVHGGPNAQTRGAFSPTVQALAEAGFVVASVNYRGSTGYGRAFEDLNNRDWGGGDLRDVVHVVHELARTREVDPRRVGIYGGSYGGYLTLRAVTAAPDVWRAAVDMYGMPDLAADFRLTADRFGSWYLTEMGDPDGAEASLYRDRSPIHALDRVRASLLVLQGANDSNVPAAESAALVAALRARGRTVDQVVYPGEGHGFTHREHRVDAIERTVRFFVNAL